jgi:hypothetical protein
MREYDDNVQHYAPVLRRIIILVAVITAVPVVMWTITAFMRTYIAQPTIPEPRPLAAATATATPPVETATITPAAAAPAQPAPAIVEARATATDARSSDTDAKADRMRDGAANAAPTDVKPVASAMVQPTVAPAVAAPPPAVVSVLAAPAGSAPDAFPNPAPMLAAQAAPAPAATDDALPPSDPITGPVPLPRHRPSVFASAEPGVPLPRARPGDAPEPSSTMTDAPSVHDLGIGGIR